MTIRALGVFWFALALGASGFAAFAASPATAARPVPGARYVEGGGDVGASLRVSKSGRQFVAGRSVVYDGCEHLHLGTRRQAVRIDSTGRFSYTRRRGRFVLTVSGRFGSKNLVHMSYRFRRIPRRKSKDCDDTGRVQLSLRRIRRIPFKACRTHRAKSVFSAPTGRVFWEPRFDEIDGWIKVAYGCLFSVNKRFKLEQDDDDDSDLGLFRLVGSYVAYHQEQCPHGCGFSVHVLDLRSGAKIRRAPGYFGPFFGRVTDLELKGNGSVAWIAKGPPADVREPPSVSAHDSRGFRQLDTGNIALESLILSASTLTWVRDGVARSAALD